MDSVSEARQSIENTVKIVSCCYVCNTLITSSNLVVASQRILEFTFQDFFVSADDESELN